jgi:hypothetical protein
MLGCFKLKEDIPVLIQHIENIICDLDRSNGRANER